MVLACSSLAQAQGLRIDVVDAETVRPVGGAAVTRWASQWQPRILLPPGKFWFPETAVATDAGGRVTIAKVAGDDWYAVKVEGYEEGYVEKARDRYQFTARSGGRARNLAERSGAVILPLKRSDSTPANPSTVPGR